MHNLRSYNILTINLKALAKNYQFILANIKNDTECAAVVKADAYGLGIEPVVKKLSSLGCSKFFVANLDEAIRLRLLTLTDEIYVLNGLINGQEGYFFEHNLIPIINTVTQAQLWQNYAKRKRQRLPAIIHVDTGINRLGMSLNEARTILDSDIVDNLKILYLMSHFSCAEDCKNGLNTEQYNQVIQFTKFSRKIPISLCNSSGIFLGRKYHFDLVRVGAAIYGLKVSPKFPKLNPVISLTSVVIQVRVVEKDCYVGYGATKKVKAGTKLATIPLGYADGILHSSSNNGYFYIADVKVPIVGRVSMDSLVVDASKVPEKELFEGAEVEIIGPNCTLEHIAEFSSTINYEILLALGNRYKRIYIE